MKPPRRCGCTLEMTSAIAGTKRPDTNTMKMTDAQIAIGTGTGGRLVVISSGAIEIRPMAVNICCLPYRSASLPM